MKRFIFVSQEPIKLSTEDSGQALVVDEGDPVEVDSDEDTGMAVRIHSWDASLKHEDLRPLEGKYFRVVVEVFDTQPDEDGWIPLDENVPFKENTPEGPIWVKNYRDVAVLAVRDNNGFIAIDYDGWSTHKGNYVPIKKPTHWRPAPERTVSHPYPCCD